MFKIMTVLLLSAALASPAVSGMMNDCEGSDYCVEFIKITGAKAAQHLSVCDNYDTSPERAACRVHLLKNCPKTPISAWRACWDSHDD